jgi:hypothetical protein
MMNAPKHEQFTKARARNAINSRFLRFRRTQKSSTKLVKNHQHGETVRNDWRSICLRRLLTRTGHQDGEKARGAGDAVYRKIIEFLC